MSVSRSCRTCRDAKLKCDLSRPVCGRCLQRGLVCSGFPADEGFIFRDENDVAQRNSQRSRRDRRRSIITRASSSTTSARQAQQMQQQYQWLSNRAVGSIPEPLKRDVETRAVERFFVNWTLYPSNHGQFKGHMHDLPILYHTATQDSILWLAVRAVAFADMKNQSAGTSSFSIKAQQQYGAALSRTRLMIQDQQDLANERVLSAMLLIDNFELMYLGRADPIGPHSEAIKHIMRSGGDEQLYSPTRFSLWCLAHYRLQSWQTMFCEPPDPEQIAWLDKLNLDQPDLHICADVLHMNVLSAMTRKFTQPTENIDIAPAAKYESAQQLIREIHVLLTTVETWMSRMTGAWKPKLVDRQIIVQTQEPGEQSDFPLPRFPCPHLLSYDDIWLAYIWNFHAASQIVLREALVDVISYANTLQSQGPLDADEMAAIRKQQDWVEGLSTAIIQSFPTLLGFTAREEDSGKSRIIQQGKMAGRLFSIFSMWAIQRARFTSAQHKETASEVVAWVNSRHGLA